MKNHLDLKNWINNFCYIVSYKDFFFEKPIKKYQTEFDVIFAKKDFILEFW